jgi:hypothetical protein
MTKYNYLLRQMEECAGDYYFGPLISKAADAIKELVDERDRYKANQQQWVAAFQESRDRAEKAEADLAAARAALRHFADSLADMHGGDHHDDGCPDCAAMIEHAPAIAAARAEGGE